MPVEQRYAAFERAKEYTKLYTLEANDEFVVKQEDGYLGYASVGQLATTGSNIFEGGQIIDGNLTIVGDIYANTFNVTTTSVSHFSASTTFGLDTDDTHTFTGSVYITGSLSVIGGINGVINSTNGVVSSSAQITSFGFVSGSYETTGRGIISSSTNLVTTSSFNSYTASISTASLVTSITNLNTFTASQSTSSLVSRLNAIENVSGSWITESETGSFLTSLNGAISSSAQITAFGFISSSTTINTGSFAITGSNLFRGDQTISGSLFISGTTELGGDIVPKTARGATLGTLERPFADIFVSSGSINIAGISGDPNTTLSNVGGNILISAGGMRLVEPGNSFIAATGSFQYLSGSFTHIGAQFNIGDIVTTGSLKVSGSTVMIGNNTMTGNTILIGTTELSGAFDVSGSQHFIGNQSLTGSLTITGSTTQIGNNTLQGITTITGSLIVSGSQSLLGTQILRGNKIITGSISVSGSQAFIGDQILSGSKTISGSLNVNGSIYKDGNKQFNYGQWASLYTQSGSANTAYAMKLETPTDGLSGMYVGNNGSGLPTRIYAQHTGLYNIQFSAQLHTTANEACDFSVWFAMTGSAISYSNTDFSIEKITGGGFQVAALNFLTPITSGSYVEIYWSKTTANGQLQAKGIQASPARPATPSVIATITQIA
jgi:acetyltransferase-like isoleucine patch superfamily enzyme